MDKRVFSFGGILILCVTTSTYGHIFRSDYNKLKDGWLKFHTIPQKWDEAVMTCNYEGAVLASPLNDRIREELTTTMIRHGLTKAPIFTGIHNKYSNYVYQSMEGVPLSDMQLVWKNLPSGQSTENCIVMNLDGSVAESMCQERHNFACYKSDPVDIINECGTVDGEYVKSNVTGSCYKFHQDKQEWSKAYRICTAEGGHLAVINSREEAKVIRELAKEHSPLDESISIGFRTWIDKKTWLTVHGQSLYAAGYSKWAMEEPNNSVTDHAEGEYCGGVIVKSDAPNNHDILNDESCLYEYPFICEMKPRVEDKYTDLVYRYLN